MHKLKMLVRLSWAWWKGLLNLLLGRPKGIGRAIVVPGGVGRSGTNMVIGCFHNSPDTTTFFENDTRLYDNYHMRGDERLTELYRESRAPYFVFKALLESHRITDFLELFPGSKSIWIYRNVEDMVNSHMRNWPGHRESIDEIVKDASAGGYRAQRMTPETHELIKSLYKPEQSEEDCAALFWILRNRLFFDQSLDTNPDSLLFCYEKFVQNPEHHIRSLCAHTGIPYSPKIHSHIHARSISKNKPPVISAPIAAACAELYNKFEAVEQVHAARYQAAQNS